MGEPLMGSPIPRDRFNVERKTEMIHEREVAPNVRLSTSHADLSKGVFDFKAIALDGVERYGSAHWKEEDISSEDSGTFPKDFTTQSTVQVVLASDELFDDDISFYVRGDIDLVEKFVRGDASVKREICKWVVAYLFDDPHKAVRVDFDGVGSDLIAILK